MKKLNIENMKLKDLIIFKALMIRKKIRFFIGKKLPPRPIINEKICGLMLPTCPRCGDMVYYRKQCVSCGQRFLNVTDTLGSVIEKRMEAD